MDKREPYECAWCGARYMAVRQHKVCPKAPPKESTRAKRRGNATRS